MNKANNGLFRFIFFSLFGIFLFFVPVYEGQVPIVLLVNTLKKTLGSALNYIVLLSTLALLGTYLLSKFGNNQKIKERHKSDGIVNGILYVLATIFVCMFVFKIGPSQLLDANVGGLTLSLAGSVLLTVTIAGWLVVFIMKSGIVDFVGILIEPIMRPVYKLPGEAAVNGLTAFVSAPAVGVYFTKSLYEENVYTEKETISVLTNFSVCSIGFFGVLVSIGGIVELYPQVVLTSLIVTFIMAAITVRIPPISFKRNIYKNGIEQTPEIIKQTVKSHKINRARRALDTGIEKSTELTLKSFINSLFDAAKFAQSIVAFVLSVATIALFLAEYTPVFDILGKPFTPYLSLFGIEDAASLGPSAIVGIADMALPVIIVAGQGIAKSSMFFITVLATVQIIFFAESANAMLEVDVPINAGELAVVFLIRTIIAIPLVALFMHLLF